MPCRDGVLPFSGSSAPGHGWTQDDRSPPEIKGQEKLLEYKENAAEKQRVKDQRELNELKLKQEEIDDRINKKEFQMKLIGWQKEGQGLTKEEYAAFTGEGAPAWMKDKIWKPQVKKVGVEKLE